MSAVRKAIAALIGVVITWVITAAADGTISTADWRHLAVELLIPVGVYIAPRNVTTNRKGTP